MMMMICQTKETISVTSFRLAPFKMCVNGMIPKVARLVHSWLPLAEIYMVHCLGQLSMADGWPVIFLRQRYILWLFLPQSARKNNKVRCLLYSRQTKLSTQRLSYNTCDFCRQTKKGMFR